MGDNAGIRNLMIHCYGEECWLGGKICRDNPLTYHHIKPVREGGRGTLENGALLTAEKHQLFNELESRFPEYAAEINEYFIVYNGVYPIDVWERIQYLLSFAKCSRVCYNNKVKCKKRGGHGRGRNR